MSSESFSSRFSVVVVLWPLCLMLPCSDKCWSGSSEGRIRVRNVLKSTGGADLCTVCNKTFQETSALKTNNKVTSAGKWTDQMHTGFYSYTLSCLKPWQQPPSLHVLQKLRKTLKLQIPIPNLYLLGNHSSDELLLVITFIAFLL